MRNRMQRRRRTATVAVEFALVAPVIILLFFGTVELVRYNLLRHTANNAAYEAARHVIVPGASRDEAEQRARGVLAMLGIQGAGVTILPAVITEETPAVEVEISIPMNENCWGLTQVFSGQTIQAKSLLRTERVPMVQAGSLPEPPPPAASPEPTPSPPPDEPPPADSGPSQPEPSDPTPPPPPPPAPSVGL